MLREGFREVKPQTLLDAACAWLAPNRHFQMQVMWDCILSSCGGWCRSIRPRVLWLACCEPRTIPAAVGARRNNGGGQRSRETLTHGSMDGVTSGG